MKRFVLLSGALLFVFVSCLPVPYAYGDDQELLSRGIFYEVQGTLKLDAPDYKWWYGCAPTAACMMMGYYDRNGYGGLNYSRLVAGAVAESSTYPSAPGTWSYAAQSAIASSGHVAAFYGGGYKQSGDDQTRLASQFNCLADFMGTSQDNLYNGTGNANGETHLYFWTDGARYYARDSYQAGEYNLDGMFGIYEYLSYCGYAGSDPSNVTDIYTQLTTNRVSGGFSFSDYKAEIDAGRVVLLHATNHSMLGYGYGDDETVYFNDTWTDAEHSMTWTGTYSDMTLWGVTCFTPTGGSPVPVPPAVWLLGSGLLGLVGIRRWKRD